MASRIHSVLLAAAITLAFSSVAGAQAEPVRRGPRPGPGLRGAIRGGTEGLLPLGPLFSLEFPGGTLAEYVATILKSVPDVAIVLDEQGGTVEMPPVSLKRVSVATALNLVPSVVSQDPPLQVQQVNLDAGDEGQVFVVSFPAGGPRLANPHQPPQEKSLLVRSLGGRDGEARLRAESVLTALDTALGIQAKEGREKDMATVKLHADSGLLMIYGNPAQLMIAEQVLGMLESESAAPQGAAPPDDARMVALEKAVEQLQAEIWTLQAAIADLRKGNKAPDGVKEPPAPR